MPLDGGGFSGVADRENYRRSTFLDPGSPFVFSVPVRNSAFFVPGSGNPEP